MLAFRPFGAYEARMTRNERKDAINANFATISAVSSEGCAVVPPAAKPLEDGANTGLGNCHRRMTVSRIGKFVASYDGPNI